MSVTPEEARRIAQERDEMVSGEEKSLFQTGLEAVLERVGSNKAVGKDNEYIDADEAVVEEELEKISLSITETMFRKYFSKLSTKGEEGQVLIHMDREDLPDIFRKMKFSTLSALLKSRLSEPVGFDTVSAALDGDLVGQHSFNPESMKSPEGVKSAILRNSVSDTEYMFIQGDNVNGIFMDGSDRIFMDGSDKRFLCFGCGRTSELEKLFYKTDFIIGRSLENDEKMFYLQIDYVCGNCCETLAEVGFRFKRELVLDKELPYIY